MEKVGSKDIALVIIGIMVTLFLTFYLQMLDTTFLEFELINLPYIFVIIIPVIIGIFIVFYMKLREIDRELENQKSRYTKLDEKLKIYNRLAKIEKRLFENGN